MRVVAGRLAGRRFNAPEGYDTRPTTDRTREAMFNALGSLNWIGGAVVLDLFAGSGALGIEALSRGAEHATFVESSRRAASVISANLESLGLVDDSSVVVGDAIAAAARYDADLVLADPPYDFERWPELLAQVRSNIVVAEAAVEVEPPDGWSVVRAKRYGRAWVTFLERVEQ